MLFAFLNRVYVVEYAQEKKNKNKTENTAETGDANGMNYQYIEATAGEAAARIIEDGDSINYKKIDPETVDDLARGAVVLGTETIDAPAPDGLIVYLKQPGGAVLALVVETETDERGLNEIIATRAGTVQEAAT